MSNNLTVYQKMTTSTTGLINVVKDELKVKSCMPFAVKALDALKSLDLKTEADARQASNTFLDNLQTLAQGGITTEDYDKIDFVKRGKVITISARVQALIRAARRKGFIITETIIAVPKEDDIYFQEEFYNGSFVYILKDARKNTDREITAERLVDGYFKNFLCRLEILDIKNNRKIMTSTEMSGEEILRAQEASENGIFVSKWVEAQGYNGYSKKKKVILNGKDGREKVLNKDSIWIKWTSEMVKKTIMRRALKNIKEALPELDQTILAFDADLQIPATEEVQQKELKIIDVEGVEVDGVDLTNLTEEQKQDVEEVFEIYKQNPLTAQKDAEEIKEKYENGIEIKDLINEYYAEIVNLSKSKKTYPLVENIIKGVPYEKN